MATANLTIQFGDPASVVAEGSISIDIDPDANTDTNFYVGGTAFLRVISNGFFNSVSYDMLLSYGSIEKVLSGIPYAITEDVTFTYSTTANLKYLPVGQMTWEWIGNTPPGSVQGIVESGTLKAPEPIVAIARVSYETLGDRWALTSDIEGPVIVVALREGKTASTTVTFVDQELSVEFGPFPWEVIVKNNATGNPEPGVTVDIDGVGVFVTDGNGRAFIGILPAGKYNVTLTKTDPENPGIPLIIPSPIDSIDNDSFTIPSSNPGTPEETI